MLDWPVIKSNLRVPRDFDEASYLKLNPDLAHLKMELRKHYLLWGQKSGKYRRMDIADVAALPLKVLRRINELHCQRDF
ncbi:MAG TPA: hypothetical protein VKB08_15385 [Bradyrhizobium sp.]|nr:hypothetical protein [Bradyrhizobium sp.]